MNKGLKNKGLGSWFCLAAALVALITGIVFLLTQATAAPLGHSGTMAGVVLLVGAAASLVFFFVSVPFSALIQAVIYNIALYLVVVQLYFVFADVINHVTFAGGNAGLCVFYMVGTFIACLLSVIACFCKQTKTGEAKATGKQFAAAGAVVVVAAVCVGGFSLQSSSLPSADNDNAEVAPDAAQTSAEGPVMKYSDNEFTSKTLDDLIAIPQETWEAKEPNGEVAYFFEGQYTEGFSTIVDPACLDMYCYTDGSMWVPSAVPAPPWAATLSPMFTATGTTTMKTARRTSSFICWAIRTPTAPCAPPMWMAAQMRISSSLTPITAHTAWKPA